MYYNTYFLYWHGFIRVLSGAHFWLQIFNSTRRKKIIYEFTNVNGYWSRQTTQLLKESLYNFRSLDNEMQDQSMYFAIFIPLKNVMVSTKNRETNNRNLMGVISKLVEKVIECTGFLLFFSEKTDNLGCIR